MTFGQWPWFKSNGKQDVFENANDNTEHRNTNDNTEMSSTLARLNNLPGYDPFQEPVIFRKNWNLLLVDKLQTFKYSIYPESCF